MIFVAPDRTAHQSRAYRRGGNPGLEQSGGTNRPGHRVGRSDAPVAHPPGPTATALTMPGESSCSGGEGHRASWTTTIFTARLPARPRARRAPRLRRAV